MLPILPAQLKKVFMNFPESMVACLIYGYLARLVFSFKVEACMKIYHRYIIDILRINFHA